MKGIFLEGINRTELEQLVEDTVKRVVSNMSMKRPGITTQMGYLNQKQVAKYLGVSIPTFQKTKHSFPEYKLSSVRKGYLCTDMDEYIQACSK